MCSPWPFLSVWQLVRDFAQINAGNDFKEYPIHSVDMKPSFPDPRQNQSKLHARHKLLEALWSACFYICDVYAYSPDHELDQKLQDPQLADLINNLCHQLRPEWEPPVAIDGSSQSLLQQV